MDSNVQLQSTLEITGADAAMMDVDSAAHCHGAKDELGPLRE
jgi:hypothetical protein